MKKGNDGYYRKTFTFDGKRYSVRATTPELLYEKLAKMKSDLKNGTKVVNGNTLVGQWAFEWLDTYKKDSVRKRTYDRYVGSLNNILIPAIGNMRIKDVRQVHLQRVLNSLKGKSEDYARKIRQMLYSIFDKAKKSNMILDNPAEDLDLPMVRPGMSRRTITAEERERILALCETHRAGLWVLTMLYCGLRPGETIPLTWNDIDFDRAVLKISKAYERGNTEFKEPKSMAGIREVPIPAPLMEKLKEYCPKDKPFDFVFQQFDHTKNRNPTGDHHTLGTLRSLWDDFKTELDISMGARYEERGQRKKKVVTLSVVADDLVPYCLRHTYCTDLEAAGVPINVASRLMGHANISITSKVYTHNSAAAFDNAANAINQYFGKEKKVGDTPSDTFKPEKNRKKPC